nr:hypothetical protein [Nannocystis sp.]
MLREQMLRDPALADLRVDGYLSKPFELDDLLSQISDVDPPSPAS